MSERRRHPRQTVDFPLEVTPPEAPDNVYQARATLLSLATLELQCDADMITTVLRQQMLPLLCSVSFQLPEQERRFQLVGQVVSHRRLSQRRYAMALTLRHEDEQQERDLEQGIAILREQARKT